MAGDNTIWMIIRNYFGYSVVGIAFVLSVMYCLITKTKYKRTLLVGLSLLVVFVLNDFSRVLIEFIGEKKTYYRFLWIVPVTVIIAYTITDLFSKCKKRTDKLIFILGLLTIMYVNAVPFIPVRSAWIPENKYNIANEVLEISHMIDVDYGEREETRIERMQSKRVALPMELELVFRTYDPSISYGISRKAYIYISENGLYTGTKKYHKEEVVMRAIVYGAQEDAKELRKCIDKLEIKYLVTQVAYAMDTYFAGIKCYPIGYSGGYVIYRVE